MITPLYSVTGFILAPTGRILTVSRKGRLDDIGLPGGKIEPGETPEDALKREILEETAVTVLKWEYLFEDLDRTSEGERRPNRCYRITAWAGPAKTMEPGSIVAWRPVTDLITKDCTFREYNLRLLKHLGYSELGSFG